MTQRRQLNGRLWLTEHLLMTGRQHQDTWTLLELLHIPHPAFFLFPLWWSVFLSPSYLIWSYSWFCPGVSSLPSPYSPKVTSTFSFSNCSLQIGDSQPVFFQQNSLFWAPDFLSVCLFSTHTFLPQGRWNFISECQEQWRWGDTPSPRSKKPQ